MHPVAVVEQRRRSAKLVGKQSVESSIQPRQKRVIPLVEVDEIGGSPRIEPVSPLRETARRPRFRELLSGEDENNVPPFVSQRHSVGERTLPYDPPDVHPQRLVHPRTCSVEVLVAKGTHHAEKFPLCTFARHTREKTDDPWHGRWPLDRRDRHGIACQSQRIEKAGGIVETSVIIWSRREDLNAPSADWNSAALALSYTGAQPVSLRTTSREH